MGAGGVALAHGDTSGGGATGGGGVSGVADKGVAKGTLMSRG